MANGLKMATVNSIVTLIEGGYSDRHIADVLNVDRGTVAKYRREYQNPPNAPPGSTAVLPGVDDGPANPEADPPKRPTGPDSLCEPHREVILQKLEQRLTAQRIHQDLVDKHGFSAK